MKIMMTVSIPGNYNWGTSNGRCGMFSHPIEEDLAEAVDVTPGGEYFSRWNGLFGRQIFADLFSGRDRGLSVFASRCFSTNWYWAAFAPIGLAGT